MKWKLYKEATGEVNNTNAVSVNIADIDDIVNEYRVVVTINVSTVTKGKFCFDIMPKEYGTYLQGYYNNEEYSGCVSLAYNITDFYVTNTNTWTKINAPNVNLANTTIKVYYR